MIAALLFAIACTPQTGIELPYTFDTRTTSGEVRVLPVLALHEPVQVSTETYLGAGLPWPREAIRLERVATVESLPDELRHALPGAVNAAVQGDWGGQFRLGAFPPRGKDRLARALHERGRVDVTLGRIARRSGGEATLFTWIDGLDAQPVSADGFPGEFVHTAEGPVLVDLIEEAHVVTVDLGMALVAADGHVILRYEDRFDTVLNGRDSGAALARAVAREMAGEVEKVWARESEFGRTELVQATFEAPAVSYR